MTRSRQHYAILLAVICFLNLCLSDRASADPKILEEFPKLNDYVFEEPKASIQMGFGVTPFGVMKSKIFFGFNFFQIHFVKKYVDWEIFNGHFGMAVGTKSYTKSYHFTFRTAPKFRIVEFLSFGPLLGYEFAHFPGVKAQLTKSVSGVNRSTDEDTFSTSGLVYGGIVSQNFELSKGKRLRVNELVYVQNFFTKTTFNDWNVVYTSPTTETSATIQDNIKAQIVFLIEINYVFD